MSIKSSFKNILVAMSAALTLSTVTVGAAIGPVHAAGIPFPTMINA